MLTNSHYAYGEISARLSSGAGSYDQVYSNTNGYESSGDYLEVYQYVYSYDTPFLGGYAGMDTSVSVVPPATTANSGSYSSFNLSHGAAYTWFAGVVSLAEVNAGPAPSNVPEPESLALMGIGLLGLAARRKSARAKAA